MNDLLRRPLTEVTALLERRELSPVELMQATLDRIDAVNGKLNAFVAMRDREQLLADARSAETRIQRGEARPLEGVPLGVKDLEDAAGLVTSHGSLVYKDNLVTRDSLQVERHPSSAPPRSRRTCCFQKRATRGISSARPADRAGVHRPQSRVR